MAQSNKISKSKTTPKHSITQMSSSDEAKQIMLDEGFRSTVYLDPKKKLTIGYGFNLSDECNRSIVVRYIGNKYDFDELRAGRQKITKKYAEMLLRVGIQNSRRELKRKFGALWNKFNHETKNILINMAYNMGMTRFNDFTDMETALTEGNYKNVVKEMRKSLWYGQTGNRAKRLIERMKKANNVK